MDGLFYTSRGSERKHDGATESVCLGDMVAQFMEESGAEDQLSPHTETIDGSVTEDCQTVNQSQQQLETLKGIISSSCSADSDVLAETCKSLEMANKMQQQQQPTYLKQLVICHLQNVGYNAAICKSRPQDNRTFPSGNYEYIDVILKNTNSDRSIRLFVDLDFRGQFEIARPTSEYSALLGLLPKIYVGRAHKLQSIVKIMCEAVKKSLERKGMNLPPWRKYGYMRSMWLGSYKRTGTCAPCGWVPITLPWVPRFYFMAAMVLIVSLQATAPESKMNMVFYMHDNLSRTNLTSFPVAGLKGSSSNPGKFGTVIVMSDVITRGPNSESGSGNIVGRAQGAYVNTNLVTGLDFFMAFTLIFQNLEYKGSTLEFQGTDRFDQPQSEYAVVGGTGKFRFAVVTTESSSGPNAVLKFNTTLLLR